MDYRLKAEFKAEEHLESIVQVQSTSGIIEAIRQARQVSNDFLTAKMDTYQGQPEKKPKFQDES